MPVWTDAEIASIKAAVLALASGQRIATVTFADRTVTYESAQLPDLIDLLSSMEAAAGNLPNRYAAFSKGTRC